MHKVKCFFNKIQRKNIYFVAKCLKTRPNFKYVQHVNAKELPKEILALTHGISCKDLNVCKNTFRILHYLGLKLVPLVSTEDAIQLKSINIL